MNSARVRRMQAQVDEQTYDKNIVALKGSG